MRLGGGIATIREYLEAGLVDETHLDIAAACSEPARACSRGLHASTSPPGARLDVAVVRAQLVPHVIEAERRLESRLLLAVAFAMAAARPAARPTLAFLQLLLRSPDATLSGHLLLGILNPADELVAGQGRDVHPCIKRCPVADQRFTQVCWKLVHHPTGDSRATHGAHGSGSGAVLPSA